MSATQTTIPVDEAIRQAAAAFARGAPQDAERLARAALAQSPRYLTALQMIGVALLMQGRAKEAVAPLREARGQRQDAVLDTQLATALRLTGASGEAEALLRPVVQNTPPYPPAFHELAALLHATRRFAEADQIAVRGLAIAPQMPDLWIVSGMSRLDLGDRAGARRQLDKALSIAPDHPRALYALGIVYLESGDFNGAAGLLQRALQTGQAPAQAFVSLASCLFELGRREEGIECLRRAIEADPALYPKAVKVLVTTSRGLFILKPSAIEALLKRGQRLAARN
jgi:tetratricopeptide (TPR) repeat protein